MLNNAENISGFNGDNIESSNILLYNSRNISGFNSITEFNSNIYADVSDSISGFNQLQIVKGDLILDNSNNISGFENIREVNGVLSLNNIDIINTNSFSLLNRVDSNFYLESNNLTNLNILSNFLNSSFLGARPFLSEISFPSNFKINSLRW